MNVFKFKVGKTTLVAKTKAELFSGMRTTLDAIFSARNKTRKEMIDQLDAAIMSIQEVEMTPEEYAKLPDLLGE